MPDETNEVVAIDLDDLELGEVEELEESLGQSLSEIDVSSARVIVRLIWITKKRNDPKYTLDKARKIKLRHLPQDQNGDEPAPPTPAKGTSKRAGTGRR
jgi:hypothetical protein